MQHESNNTNSSYPDVDQSTQLEILKVFKVPQDAKNRSQTVRFAYVSQPKGFYPEAVESLPVKTGEEHPAAPIRRPYGKDESQQHGTVIIDGGKIQFFFIYEIWTCVVYDPTVKKISSAES